MTCVRVPQRVIEQVARHRGECVLDRTALHLPSFSVRSCVISVIYPFSVLLFFFFSFPFLAARSV